MWYNLMDVSDDGVAGGQYNYLIGGEGNVQPDSLGGPLTGQYYMAGEGMVTPYSLYEAQLL